jgi:hypothetical protein
VIPDLVAELARLAPEQRLRVVRAAKSARQRQLQRVVCEVRLAMLPGLSARQAAREIADAARKRRCGADPALRARVQERLTAELGDLHDVPGAARIRQWLSGQ